MRPFSTIILLWSLIQMWQREWVCTTNQSLGFDRVLYKLRGGEEKVRGNNGYAEVPMNTRFQAFQPGWVCRKTNKTINTNPEPLARQQQSTRSSLLYQKITLF